MSTAAPRVRCIGHAGASGLVRGNTLRSLALAAALGADAVEVDVRAVGGRLVLAHSPFDARRPHCLALEDALHWLATEADAGLGVLLDLKTAGTEEPVVASLRRFGLLERAVLASQCRPILRRVRTADPRARTALSVAGVVSRAIQRWGDWRETVLAELRAEGYGALMAHRRLVDAALVERVRAAGAELHAWTVRDRADAEALARLGVDGIVTTDPRLVVAPAPAVALWPSPTLELA